MLMHFCMLGLTGQGGYDVVTYRYDIYGEETQSAATYNPYRYNGEYTDMSTGLQYLRARYYSAEITRFTSKDPVLGVATLPYTFNPYLYCLNNAINYRDPSGNFAILAAVGIGAAIGAVVNGGINVYEQYKENNNSFNNFSWGSLGKDALIGGVAGGVGGLAGGVVAGSAAAIVGGTAAMTTGQVITVGVVSSVAAGSMSRLTDATLDNVINGANRDPYGEATDLRAVATDAVLGGVSAAIPRLTWGERLTEKAKAISYKKYCENGTPKAGKQSPSNPVDIPDEQFAQWQDDAKKAIDKANDAFDAGKSTIKANSNILKRNLEELPQNVQEAYNRYDKSGWKGNVSGQTPGTKAGSIYQNRDGKLPTTDAKGNSITYKEWDVNNKQPGATRDSERFVTGSDGSIYYTDSHYGDGESLKGLPPFIKIR